jgi:hypothetical protein
MCEHSVTRTLESRRAITRPMLFEVAIPALVMGLSFPLANAVVQDAERAVGRRAGVLYFSTTIGAVGGSLTAGFLLLPALGMHQWDGHRAVAAPAARFRDRARADSSRGRPAAAGSGRRHQRSRVGGGRRRRRPAALDERPLDVRDNRQGPAVHARARARSAALARSWAPFRRRCCSAAPTRKCCSSARLIHGLKSIRGARPPRTRTRPPCSRTCGGSGWGRSPTSSGRSSPPRERCTRRPVVRFQ